MGREMRQCSRHCAKSGLKTRRCWCRGKWKKGRRPRSLQKCFRHGWMKYCRFCLRVNSKYQRGNKVEGWEKIAGGIYMRRTDERVCSTIYMLDGGSGGRLIIDSGDGKMPIGFVPEICILTHGHYDHTGGVEENWEE